MKNTSKKKRQLIINLYDFSFDATEMNNASIQQRIDYFLDKAKRIFTDDKFNEIVKEEQMGLSPELLILFSKYQSQLIRQGLKKKKEREQNQLFN